MIETFRDAFKNKDIRKKILMTILFIFIYRIGCYIVVPGFVGIDMDDSTGVDLVSILNAITGSALSNGTLFAIGISPYINASIIMQLLTYAIPSLQNMSKDGDAGKKKIATITRWLTLALAIVSAAGVVVGLGGNSALDTAVLGGLGTTFLANNIWILYVFVIAVLTAGSMLTMWLGERITEHGLTNGISMIIFVGIISTASTSIVDAITSGSWLELIIFLISIIGIFLFIVWVDGAERKIKVQYAKQVKGNKMYGGQSSEIPMKINSSGVMPLIFSFALISFPSMLIATFWADSTSGFVTFWNSYMGTESVLYLVLLAVLIFLFSYFYSQMQFNPVDVAKNIQGNGGMILGVRPGRETADYLTKVVTRITLWGAIFLSLIALVPSLLMSIPTWLGIGLETGLISAFSSTGMLITVSIALELHKSLENELMMRRYKGFLK